MIGQFTICREGEKISLRVEYDYFTPFTATWGFSGGEPYEDDHVDISNVFLTGTHTKFEITKEEKEEIQNTILAIIDSQQRFKGGDCGY